LGEEESEAVMGTGATVFSKRIPGRQSLSAILLLAWLAHGIPFVLMTSDVINSASKAAENFSKEHEQSIQALKNQHLTDVDVGEVGADVKQDLTTFRAEHLSLTLVGLGAGIMAFFATRFWRVAVFVTSAIYLSLWLRSSAFAYTSYAEAFKRKWTIAEGLGIQLSFWRDDVILPLVLVGACLYVIVDFVRKRRKF
jgi:hypothetical protein